MRRVGASLDPTFAQVVDGAQNSGKTAAHANLPYSRQNLC